MYATLPLASGEVFPRFHMASNLTIAPWLTLNSVLINSLLTEEQNQVD